MPANVIVGSDVYPYQSASLPLPFSQNLQKGDQGEEVYVLICTLIELKFLGATQQVTNVFNDNVFEAVRWAQRRFGLDDDGVVGPMTKAALEGALQRERRGETRTDFIFPLRARKNDYHIPERYFGAPRPNVRKHAGCDLVDAAGSEVLAMADGVIIEDPYEFFCGTYALEIKHDNGFVVRYGEVSPASVRNMHRDKRVMQGDVIAQIGRSTIGSEMLHLEMYEGTETGLLTQGGLPFIRRRDLLDPTPYLDNAPLWNESPLLNENGEIRRVSPVRVTSVLSLRDQPSTSAKVLLTLTPGTRCKVLEQVSGDPYMPDNLTDWLKIEVNGQQGYVAAYYIEEIGKYQDRWTQALINAPTTGASALTAGTDGLAAGVDASHQMARADLERVRTLIDRFRQVGARTGLPPAILAAIASRESRCGHVLEAEGWGYDNCGYGIMQVDRRYHHLEGFGDPKSVEHIEQAARIFSTYLKQVQFNHADWQDGFLLKGAAVAYNSGVNNVQTRERMDIGTTGDDYGSDVIARAQFYYDQGIV